MNLMEILAEFPRKNVLVLGDVMIDKYIHGDVGRVSPEAPVVVLNITREEDILGGAANTANNLASLAAKVSLVGLAGPDANKETLLACLERARIDSSGIVIDQSRKTTVKMRLVSGRYQIARADYESTHKIGQKMQAAVLKLVRDKMAYSDVLVLSDYNKGITTEQLMREIVGLANQHRIPIVVDCKPKNVHYFRNATLLTPNLKEAREMSGIPDSVEQMGRVLVERLNANIFIKCGEEGITVFDKSRGLPQYVVTKKVPVSDVTGAGDTVVAVAALGLACGMEQNLFQLAELANAAGRIVVQKPGTATVTIDELKKELIDWYHSDS